MIRLLFFLIGCNIYQLANYLVLVLCVVLVFANRAKIELKRSGLLFIVSVASITYWAIYMINYDSLPISTIFGRILVPILFVYIGLDRAKQGFESFILDVLYIGFGEFVHGILNVISNRNTPILTIAGRAYNDFWGGTISATIQNLLFIIPCSLLFYFLIIERRQFIKYMGLLAAFGGIVGTIASASRTLLYLTGLCFIVSLAYIFGNTNTIKNH